MAAHDSETVAGGARRGPAGAAAGAKPAHTRPPPNVWKAVAWIGLSLLCFVLTAIAGREAGRTVPAINMVFWRNAISLVLLLVWFRIAGITLSSLVSVQPGMQIARALAHFAGQLSWMSALLLIPLVELFAIEFTVPLWVAVLAPFMIGEKLTRTRIIAAVTGFVGVLIIVRPGFANVNQGTLLALLCALLFAFNLIGTRYLTKRDGAFTILLYMAANHTVLGLLLGFRTLAMPDVYTGCWLLVMGIASLAAHFGLTRAIAYADAIVVAPMDFMRLPLIAVIGALAYGEPLSVALALGAAIVLAANVINLWGERSRAA